MSAPRLGPTQVSENDPLNQSPSRHESPSRHKSPSPHKSPSRPKSSKHRGPPEEALVARLTVSVEEVVLPREGGVNRGLRELLQVKPTTLPRYYVVHGRYGEEEPCVSRAVQAQEGVPLSEGKEAGGSAVGQKRGGGLRVALEHSCEIETPFEDELLKYLEQRLAVEVWKVEKVKSNPSVNTHTNRSQVSQPGANRDRLVGTAFVGLSPLLDHGIAGLGAKGEPGVKRATSMSGVFTLVHPDSPNLGDASVKVRVLLQVESSMEEKSRVSGKSPSMEPADGASDSGSPSAMGSPSETGSLKGTFQRELAVGTRKRASGESDPEKAGRFSDHEESDDVEDEDWLQQRAEEALRRSADLHSTRAGGGRRSVETQAGSRQSRVGVNRRFERQEDSGSEWEGGEGVATARVQMGEGRLDSEKDEVNQTVWDGGIGNQKPRSRQTEQQSGRQPSSETQRQSEQANTSSDRASSPERREGGGGRGDLGADEVRRSNAYRRAREEGFEGFVVSRGPAKRVAWHVTVTAPPKRGRTWRAGGRSLGQWAESGTVNGSGQGKPTTIRAKPAHGLGIIKNNNI
jgi:hypothetical protein